MIGMSRKHSHPTGILKDITHPRQWVNLVKKTIGKSTFEHKELPHEVKSLSFLKRSVNDGWVRE